MTDDVMLMGSLSGLSVKPNKDGGLDGKLTVHFSIDPDAPLALTELMRTLVKINIERMQAPLFGAADGVTGELAGVH